MAKKILKTDYYAKWTLIVGAVLMFGIPFLLPFVDLEFLGKFGPIGDTVGGITSPIAQFFGSILLYLALKAQLDANAIIQDQIEEDDRQQVIRHELEQLHELYVFFENNIKNFSHEIEVSGGQSQKSAIYGRRAIRTFIADLEDMKINIHNDEDVLTNHGAREVLSVLNSAKLILEKIEDSQISDRDKLFYETLLRHELQFSVFPYTDLDKENKLMLPKCEVCQINHGYFPPIILTGIEELKGYFKQSDNRE